MSISSHGKEKILLVENPSKEQPTAASSSSASASSQTQVTAGDKKNAESAGIGALPPPAVSKADTNETKKRKFVQRVQEGQAAKHRRAEDAAIAKAVEENADPEQAATAFFSAASASIPDSDLPSIVVVLDSDAPESFQTVWKKYRGQMRGWAHDASFWPGVLARLSHGDNKGLQLMKRVEGGLCSTGHFQDYMKTRWVRPTTPLLDHYGAFGSLSFLLSNGSASSWTRAGVEDLALAIASQVECDTAAKDGVLYAIVSPGSSFKRLR
jgi:hypothetical protein